MTPPRFVGPLSLLAACILPIIGAFAINQLWLGVVGVAAQLVGLGWLLRDPRGTAKRLVFGVVAAVSIMVSSYLYGGQHLDETFGAGLRIIYIVLPAAMLSPVIRPSALGDHLGQRLRLPARHVVGAVAALQRLDSIGNQWSQIQRARRARGLGVDGSPARRLRSSAGTAFALLVVSMRQTASMAVAMDARGFAAATRRTWAEPAPWRWGDSLVLAVAVGLAVLPWVLRLGLPAGV